MIFEYPAIFSVDKDDPNWVNVQFPDIYPGVTCGEGMDDAIYMAKDLLRLMLTSAPNQCFPPTKLDKLRKEYPGATIIMIEVENDEIVDC